MEEQFALYDVIPMPAAQQSEPEEPIREEPLIGQISLDELLREIRT